MNHLDVIAGKNPVREALRAGRPVEVVLYAGVLDPDIFKLARARGTTLRQADRHELDAITPRHQNIVAVLRQALRWSEPEEMLAAAEAAGEPPLIVVLDEIQDPRNLGAALRVADTAGAHGVIIPRHRSSPPTEVVARSAAGATAYVRMARVTNLVQTIDRLKAAGIWVAGLEAGGTSMWEADLDGPLALVLGGEGRGLRRLVREHCDFLVGIPMFGAVGSLNAATALGVVLYEVRRRRANPGRQP